MPNATTKRQLASYLSEDLARGDITSGITPIALAKAVISVNEDCIVAGVEEVLFLFRQAGLNAKAVKKDGARAKKGMRIILVTGGNRKILPLERVCLNILGRMSGVATLCAKAKKIAGKRITIAVTRKTSPGFQMLDKKAAEIAGCWSHRKNLSEMILLKDNHLNFFKSVALALKAAKKTGKKTEIEAESGREALEAAKAKPAMIMLDNFPPMGAKKTILAMRKAGYKGKIELSGGITLNNLKKYSELGADIISMGELTKNARIIDFSLEITRVK